MRKKWFFINQPVPSEYDMDRSDFLSSSSNQDF